MRNLVVCGLRGVLGLVLAGSVLAQSNPGKRETLVEWHFIGHRGLKKLTGLKPLQAVLNLPETEQLWNTAFERWGRKTAERYSKSGAADPHTSAVISSLIRDIVAHETTFELSSSQEPDWALGIRLPAEHHETWSTNLWQMALRAKLGTPRPSGKGWAVEANEKRYNLRLTREKDWTIVTGGSASSEAESAFIRRLPEKSEPDFVLQAKADLSKLTGIWNSATLKHAPRASINVSARGEDLRSETELTYPEDLGFKPEKWNIPKDVITDPLVGLTAIQGIQKHVEQHPLFKHLKLAKTPNQLFVWSQSISPFSTYFAADVGDPKKLMDSLVTYIQSNKDQLMKKFVPGEILYNTNANFLAWKGLPIAVPFLRPGYGQNSNFVMGGIFPLENPSTKPAPEELWAELDKKNLVFYEWEITAERMPIWRVFSQVLRIAQDKPFLPPESPSEKWIVAATPLIGNTITTITMENPKTLQMIRRSHIGFNGLELVALAHALDNAPVRPSQERGNNPPPPLNPPSQPPARKSP